MLADRGHSTTVGNQHVAAAGAHATVRVNTGSPLLETTDDKPIDLLTTVESLQQRGSVGKWSARAVAKTGPTLAGRVCAIRKTEGAIQVAHAKIHKVARRKGKQVQPETLRFAWYVTVFTTYPPAQFPASKVLEWYRLRWQVELVFKRFKSLAQLGHLPKYALHSVATSLATDLTLVHVPH